MQWEDPDPMVTKFTPGHDARLLSTRDVVGASSVNITFEFSTEMGCDSVTNSIAFNSTTDAGGIPTLKASSVVCGNLSTPEVPLYVGAIVGTWLWSATLENVQDGIHAITVRNATSSRGIPINANERFLFRIGESDNPVVFTSTATYSKSLFARAHDGSLTIRHAAAGADSWRYSTNWGTEYSDWERYTGGTSQVEIHPWTGTKAQEWPGEHIRVEYFSRLAGSSDHVQEGDIDYEPARHFAHLWLNGPYNMYGYDPGLQNQFKHTRDSQWEIFWMNEWPAVAQINAWGINSDGHPDQSLVLGDIDGDSVLDRLPPSSLTAVVLNMSMPPVWPYLGYKVIIHDDTLRYDILPYGDMRLQIVLFVLLCILPLIGGGTAVWIFIGSFYGVKFNAVGVSEKRQNCVPDTW